MAEKWWWRWWDRGLFSSGLSHPSRNRRSSPSHAAQEVNLPVIFTKHIREVLPNYAAAHVCHALGHAVPLTSAAALGTVLFAAQVLGKTSAAVSNSYASGGLLREAIGLCLLGGLHWLKQYWLLKWRHILWTCWLVKSAVGLVSVGLFGDGAGSPSVPLKLIHDANWHPKRHQMLQAKHRPELYGNI